MAAKRKKSKRAAESATSNDQRVGFVPPANGSVGRSGGVGGGQATPQARRYAFRRS